MKLAVLVSLSCGLTIAQDLTEPVHQQASEIQLADEVNLHDGSTREVLRAILAIANRPGGIATILGCDPATQRSFHLPAGNSLAHSLDSVISLDQTYVWTMQQGVVNVLPKQSIPDVLHVVIEHFEWTTSDSPHLTIGRLFQSDAVRKRFSDRGLVNALQTLPGLQKPPRIIDGRPEPSLLGQSRSINGLGLLAALNAVASSYGNVLWWYEERTCGSERTYRSGAR